MKRILFVCTGNTCRSAMAEGLFKKMIEDMGKEDEIEVSSCGIAAIDGMPASLNAQKVAKEYGIDISSHRSRLLKKHLLEADLILTMTKSHKDFIINKFPDTKGRVFVLGEFADTSCADDDIDIDDPFGRDEEVYRKVAEQIKSKLQHIINRLLNN